MPSRPDRWSQYDETSYRTGGMERVGYDADTQRSYFQEGTDLYEGEPGAEFGGNLRYIGQAAPLETEPVSNPTHSTSVWRRLASFFLAIGVVLLLITRYSSALSYWPSTPVPTRQCYEGLELYKAVPGDDCWTIANSRGWSLEKLRRANGDLNCKPLSPGALMCVPPLP